MGDEFESETGEDEIFASITPRKLDRITLMALWLQYRARKKLVKGDLYVAISDGLLLHRAYKEDRAKFQEAAGREIEALVTAVEGASHGTAQ